jgi:tellurite resistance protein
MKLGKDVFVALAAVVWCDGKVSDNETNALLSAASAWGIEGDDFAEVQRCITQGVSLDIIMKLKLEQEARLLVFALGAWLTKVDGVVVPTEGAMLDRLAASLKLSPEERMLAQSDGMLAAAIMGQTTSGDVVAVAREIEAHANAGFEDTVRFQVPPSK